MNVNELIKHLQEVAEQGFGEDQVLTWDPDSDGYMPVTGFVYAHGDEVRLFTDDDDAGEECEHEFVSARNKVISNGEICIKCHLVRPEGVAK